MEEFNEPAAFRIIESVQDRANQIAAVLGYFSVGAILALFAPTWALIAFSLLLAASAVAHFAMSRYYLRLALAEARKASEQDVRSIFGSRSPLDRYVLRHYLKDKRKREQDTALSGNH